MTGNGTSPNGVAPSCNQLAWEYLKTGHSVLSPSELAKGLRPYVSSDDRDLDLQVTAALVRIRDKLLIDLKLDEKQSKEIYNAFLEDAPDISIELKGRKMLLRTAVYVIYERKVEAFIRNHARNTGLDEVSMHLARDAAMTVTFKDTENASEENVRQTGLLRIFLYQDTGRSAEFVGLISTMARRLVFDAKRQVVAEQKAFDRFQLSSVADEEVDNNGSRITESSMRCQRIAQIVEQVLTEQQRQGSTNKLEVIRLWLGYHSQREIGEITGLPLGTVKTTIELAFRILSRNPELRAMMQEIRSASSGRGS